MMLFCDCGRETAVANASQTIDFFIQHQHFPELVRFVCVCGSELISGPGQGITPGLRAVRDFKWLDDHANCAARVQ